LTLKTLLPLYRRKVRNIVPTRLALVTLMKIHLRSHLPKKLKEKRTPLHRPNLR
jgi:hypothetical protein